MERAKIQSIDEPDCGSQRCRRLVLATSGERADIAAAAIKILLGKDGGGYDTKAHFTSFKEELKSLQQAKPKSGNYKGGKNRNRFNRRQRK